MSSDAAPSLLVFVHGVGLWPGLFAQIGRQFPLLAGLCWTRPGYAGRPPVGDLGAQADQLAAFCDEAAGGRPVYLVGVSGGATLGLAVALRHPSVLEGVVTHEPLIGPLQPALHARVAEAGAALAKAPSPEAAERFLQLLYGYESFQAQEQDALCWARDHWGTVCSEVAAFAAFAPDEGALTDLGPRHLTTVGSRSAPERHDVAQVLARAGAETRVVDGSGHHVLIDAPVAFAHLIQDFIS